ncbi:MAG: CpaD family pilus assembly lipoprotein [Candidatus Dactylopiibacterium sp.]|nr:CpaD family pilus assembly lipoprotein [Candidatus Dactylopiibacterium sp.]
MKPDFPRPPGHAPRRHRAILAGMLALVGLSACETPINGLRASRLSGEPVPAASVAPRALALALVVAGDGQGLSEASLREANRMLQSQGRLPAQTLSITPFTPQGERVAQRLAQALTRAGARRPAVLAVPGDAPRLEEARRHGWDLELQSEALVVSVPDCRAAVPDRVMVRPHAALGPLGCATRANVAAMVSDPRDLTRPRTLDGGNGAAAAAAVARYQNGEVRDLIDIDFED